MSDDELSEEQQRKMAAKLIGGSPNRKSTTVEIRRSGNKRPEPVELRFIVQLSSDDGGWIDCLVEQKASAGWIKVETFDDQKTAERAAARYTQLGDAVQWYQKFV